MRGIVHAGQPNLQRHAAAALRRHRQVPKRRRGVPQPLRRLGHLRRVHAGQQAMRRRRQDASNVQRVRTVGERLAVHVRLCQRRVRRRVRPGKHPVRRQRSPIVRRRNVAEWSRLRDDRALRSIDRNVHRADMRSRRLSLQRRHRRNLQRRSHDVGRHPDVHAAAALRHQRQHRKLHQGRRRLAVNS